MNLQVSVRSKSHVIAARQNTWGSLGKLSKIRFANNCNTGNVPDACSEQVSGLWMAKRLNGPACD